MCSDAIVEAFDVGKDVPFGFLLTTPFMIAIQLVSAQIGRVTGKGIIANVSDFAPRWLVISLVSVLVMANTFNIAADLAAMAKRSRS